MFNRTYIRAVLAAVWVAVFLGMWAAFEFYLLPRRAMAAEIDGIERSVGREDWEAAARHSQNLGDIWRKKKLAIQINNGSESVSAFERILEQTRLLISRREDDALDYVGELRSAAAEISAAFPGP